MNFKAILTLAAFVCIAQFSFAQTSVSSEDIQSSTDFEIQDNWSFFGDAENDVLFIDFENLSVNLSDIVIKDQSGATVFSEEVLDLPVNTIFEIDLSTFKNGQYEIELKSFTGTMRRKLIVS